MDLMDTRLRKLASIATADANREEKSVQMSKRLREEAALSVEFRNFASRGEALEWMTGVPT